MIELSNQLKNVVDGAAREFSAWTDTDTAQRVKTGGWSKKEILGHLIDSASNNHQRFVRAALQDELTGPGYDQEGCVRLERYQEMQWSDLVAFWASYNRFLAHVLSGIPESKRTVRCLIGNYPPMTLEELAADYLRHLEHHLEQIRSGT
jgi:DinB family protein